MTDTHCHLYMDDYGDGRCDVVNGAIAAGVTRMVFPNVDMASVQPVRELHEAFPAETAMTMGLHPTEVPAGPGAADAVLDDMERLLDGGGYAGIGEVGIDLHFDDNPPLDIQQRAFERQLSWGARQGLPVIIHCRDARDHVLESIERVRDSLDGVPLPPLVFHSFTGDTDDVKAIRRVCDPWFGINGVVTFKNAPGLREALPEIGAGRLLLETDAPWLAPVPHRGERNESKNIPFILAACARCLGMEPDELERVTDDAAIRLFFPS